MNGAGSAAREGRQQRPQQRHNNFDALRLYAAFMVVYGHGYILTTGTGPGLWGVPFARVGLDVFFSISGYLVTASWDRESRLGAFALKRGLRIFPGLAACVAAAAFLLGLAVTSLAVGDYLRHPLTWSYLSNLALRQELFLPGVFTSLREHGAVNGSLWSLLPEVLCYATVPLFAALPRALRPWAMAAAAAGCGGLGLYWFEGSGTVLMVYGIDCRYMLVQVPFFFVGGLLHTAQGTARAADGFFRSDVSLAILAANYGVSSWYGWWNVPLEWFTLPYVVVAFGRMSLPVLNRAAMFGDLSYGTYLYAFPVQQLLLWAAPDLAHPILACAVLTLPVAVLSWRLVERPALGLKERLLRRAAPAARAQRRAARSA